MVESKIRYSLFWCGFKTQKDNPSELIQHDLTCLEQLKRKFVKVALFYKFDDMEAELKNLKKMKAGKQLVILMISGKIGKHYHVDLNNYADYFETCVVFCHDKDYHLKNWAFQDWIFGVYGLFEPMLTALEEVYSDNLEPLKSEEVLKKYFLSLFNPDEVEGMASQMVSFLSMYEHLVKQSDPQKLHENRRNLLNMIANVSKSINKK